MNFRTLELPGVRLVTSEESTDARGAFVRIFDADDFRSEGLETQFAQEAFSFNRLAGTIRGLHYQAAPDQEAKLVTCISGALYDVVVDLRHGESYGKWIAVRLDAETRSGLYIPVGCAHGFQTLVDQTVVLYHLSVPYRPLSARGIRWDDAGLRIAWPLEVTALSQRDANLPSLCELSG